MFKSLTTVCFIGAFMLVILHTSCTDAKSQVTATTKLKEYKVLIAWEKNPDDRMVKFKSLETTVNTALVEGWTPVGGITDHGYCISQTVVR
jgi:hypothetical protein